MPKLTGYNLFKSIGSPKYVVAPMVDQSEMAFRLLCKRYEAQLTYTPMFHARLFAENEQYRRQMMQVCDGDYPLMVQFCGNDPAVVLKAAKLALQMAEKMTTRNVIATIDLNLGCPQQIARRGRYGSFLMEEQQLICEIVSTLHRELPVPVSCKIRIFPDVERTIAYAKMLEKAGCQILAVHGRTREQRGHKQGLADWDQIRMVRENVSIPVIANGNIRYFSDIEECMKYTGADAVMVADSILANPAFFANSQQPISNTRLASEYLEFCAENLPPTTSAIRAHIFRILSEEFKRQVDLRQSLAVLEFGKRNLNVGKAAAPAGKDENDDRDHSTVEERIEQLGKFRAIVDKVAERERLGETVTVLADDAVPHKKTKKHMRKMASRKNRRMNMDAQNDGVDTEDNLLDSSIVFE